MINTNRVILGVSAFNHDASACLIVNDKLIAFCEEERFNSQKNTGSLPVGAIKYCLEKANIKALDINHIAFYFNIKRCYYAYLLNNNPISWLSKPNKFKTKRYLYELSWLMSFHAKVRRLCVTVGAYNAQLHTIPHHDAHVWYGIYTSERKEGVVLSNDSIGELVSSYSVSWNTEKNGSILTKTRIEQDDPNSIGYLYGAITEFLGFNRKNGAGKIMALASFGTDRYISYFFDNITLLQNGEFKIKNGLITDRSYKPNAQRLSNDFLKKFPKLADNISQTHYDIAFALQKTTEKIINHQVSHISKFSENIVLTGGVAQNSVANGLILNEFSKNWVFVPPIPHDSGCSIGAAIFVFHKLNKALPKFTETAFLGESFSDLEVGSYLKSRKLQFSLFDNVTTLVEEILPNLIEGKTFGVFRKSMECGPRALGNRSIIALPTIEGMVDHLNKNVKYRESFRPYGVIVHEKMLEEYFDVHNGKTKTLKYMSFVFQIKKEYKSVLKHIMHVDGTCRVQTISNDLFFDLIFSELRKLGYPEMIINTSLNVKGKPICRTLSDAVSCFFSSGMDYMLFNDKYLIKK